MEIKIGLVTTIYCVCQMIIFLPVSILFTVIGSWLDLRAAEVLKGIWPPMNYFSFLWVIKSSQDTVEAASTTDMWHRLDKFFLAKSSPIDYFWGSGCTHFGSLDVTLLNLTLANLSQLLIHFDKLDVKIESWALSLLCSLLAFYKHFEDQMAKTHVN